MDIEVQNISRRLDELEAAMQALPEVDCELDHVFTPGIYQRTIKMPAGTLIVSRIHKIRHPFCIKIGVAAVKINGGEWEILSAIHDGITEPGTRRVLYILEDTYWTTHHAIGDIAPEDESEEAIKKAVNQVDELILERHVNELLGGELKNNILIKELQNEN